MTTLKARMTQGNVMPWLTGILLGLVLGVALLIVTNAGAPKANDPVAEGVAVTTDASANEAAQKGNTPATAGVSQGSQGGVSDSSTNGSQETAATVGDPATTTGGEGEQEQGAVAAAASASASTASEASSAAADSTAAAGDAAAGQTLFAGTCGGCHGAQGQGALGPAMTANANTWDLAGFTQALREGKTPDGRELAPTMPRFSEGQLKEQDIANIHAWVKSL
ncbi:c-type cytochrome [Deinococcus piscis]|nr:cytochrome c [Deinococcus piscis]